MQGQDLGQAPVIEEGPPAAGTRVDGNVAHHQGGRKEHQLAFGAVKLALEGFQDSGAAFLYGNRAELILPPVRRHGGI